VKLPKNPQEEREELLRAFGEGCARAAGPAPDLTAGHAVALEQAVAVGRAAWPDIALEASAFGFHIGRVMEASAKLSDAAAAAAISVLHIADLFLACACARGVPEALAEFETRFIAPLPLVLRAGMIPLDEAETVCATLRERLLVKQDDEPPRIATYAGRGPLAAWVAIAAQRTAFSLRRHEGALQRAHDRAMKEAIAADLNPELRYMKARYREAVEVAFRDAVAELSDHDRALLRLGLVAGLSLEAIGASYKVNATTASRWLGKIRQGILDRTVALLRERLGLTDPEAASIARLVTSQIDVSVVRLL
jgi:RNA polymerase sigma-70 factor (ECF subfamily)